MVERVDYYSNADFEQALVLEEDWYKEEQSFSEYQQEQEYLEYLLAEKLGGYCY